MNLVLFNMSNEHDWRKGIVNRNYFIARELISRPVFKQVCLVDFLSIQSTKRMFGKRRTVDYLTYVKEQPSLQSGGILHSIIKLENGPMYSKEKPVYTYSGLGYLTDHKKDFLRLSKWLQSNGFQMNDTIIWSYNAFLPEVLETFTVKAKVFDTVDNWSDHASYKKDSKLLKQNYHRIHDQADIIFTTAQGLTNLYPDKPAFWVPNGIDLKNFQRDELKHPKDMPKEKKVIGYVGTIQERVDFDLIRRISKDHHDKAIVFIGPVWSGVEKEVEELKSECANLLFLGRKSFQQLPEYLNAIDVAIIPHRLDRFLLSTNPMKMYDYLAAGLPVVTTPGAGTEAFADFLSIQEDYQTFSKAIDRELQRDTSDLHEVRKQVVASHSYAARVDTMFQHIQEELDITMI